MVGFMESTVKHHLRTIGRVVQSFLLLLRAITVNSKQPSQMDLRIDLSIDAFDTTTRRRINIFYRYRYSNVIS